MLSVYHIISGDLWAGAEIMAYHLLKALQEYDELALSAILLNGGRLAEEIRTLGIEVHVVDERKMSFFHILLAVRKILSKRPPEVIHSHRYKENILAYLVSRSLRRTKLIGTQHGMPGVEIQKRNINLRHRIIGKYNFHLLSRSFNRVVAVSQDIQSALIEKYGFKKDKISVIHNGIEIPSLQPNRRNGEPFVIGSSGRLFPVKDYPFMVQIAKAILERTDNIRFELAGEGPERPSLQALIQRYGLNSTFLLKGYLEDISAFYRGLDLYLNTSIHEGIPMSVLEAMGHGLPIVAPMVGGLEEIVEDGVQGYILGERNPEAFVEKCLLLFENKALRQRMSQAAREKVVRAFSMEQMARQYYNAYVGLTKNS